VLAITVTFGVRQRSAALDRVRKTQQEKKQRLNTKKAIVKNDLLLTRNSDGDH
jgi:hypothetical protein